MGRRGKRGRRIATLAITAIAVLGVTVIVASAEDAKPGQRASLGMLLRLHELPPGYLVGDEVGCGSYFPMEGADPPLEEFTERHRARGCEVAYDRLYRVPGPGPDPRALSSLVIELQDEEGVEAAEAILPELVGRTMTGNIAPAEAPAPTSVGAHTRLFHTAHANALGTPVRGSLLTWRQGMLIGATLAGGAGTAANDRLALHFARKQARRMRNPLPYPPKARDDLLVPIDNPKLDLPVLWLGREFDAGGLALELEQAWWPVGPGGGPPGTKLELFYDGLRIGTWTEASWDSYLGTKLGRTFLGWRCTTATPIPVARGEALIYRGYARDHAVCPSKPPDVVAAVVRRGGVVLGLNLPNCWTCVEPILSAAEMEAIVRALRPRPKPVY